MRVPSWERAVCARFERSRCPRLDSCHYLHAFENPSAPPSGSCGNGDNHNHNDEPPTQALASDLRAAASAPETDGRTPSADTAAALLSVGPNSSIETASTNASDSRRVRCAERNGDEKLKTRDEFRRSRSDSRRPHSDASRHSDRASPDTTRCGTRDRSSHRHRHHSSRDPEHRLSSHRKHKRTLKLKSKHKAKH